MIIALLLFLAHASVLVDGTTNTWTNGNSTWAGNPYCDVEGYLLSPESPAIDTGALTEIHCGAPGSALNQPRLPDGSFCVEWYGSAPDIGACEFVPTAIITVPPAPTITVKVQ